MKRLLFVLFTRLGMSIPLGYAISYTESAELRLALVIVAVWSMFVSMYYADAWRTYYLDAMKFVNFWKGYCDEIKKYHTTLEGFGLTCYVDYYLQDTPCTRHFVHVDKEGKLGCKIGDDEVMVEVDMNETNLDKAISAAVSVYSSQKGIVL